VNLRTNFEIGFTDLDLDLPIFKSMDGVPVLRRAVAINRRVMRCKGRAGTSPRLTANWSNLRCYAQDSLGRLPRETLSADVLSTLRPCLVRRTHIKVDG
jgi:hypothetical protein